MHNPEEHKKAIRDVFHLKKPKKQGDFGPLIEARAEMLKPHLDKFTLKTLGEVTLHGESSFDQWTLSKLGIAVFSEVMTASVNTLDHQGIYGSRNPIIDVSIGEKGVVDIWGFSRRGVWVCGEIGFHKKRQGIGWKAIYDSQFHIREAELSQLAPIFGYDIWLALGNFIKDLQKKQEERLRVISEMHEIVKFEDTLFKI